MKRLTNSKVSRVQPVFCWLKNHRPREWTQRLVDLAGGLIHRPSCGDVCEVTLEPERKVPPTADRLVWMIRNVERLAPQDGKQWRELRQRVADQEKVANALAKLAARQVEGLPRGLALEGETSADCIIECENAMVWIEGKRFDWLSPSIKWDVTRDQLARNLEAVWSLAAPKGKDYCLIICHEHPLKHHEQTLVDGYRSGTWAGGWPHLPDALRRDLGQRIGALTWQRIADEWPALRSLSELADLGAPLT